MSMCHSLTVIQISKWYGKFTLASVSLVRIIINQNIGTMFHQLPISLRLQCFQGGMEIDISASLVIKNGKLNIEF